MQKIRVLIFPCGAENALELHDALAYCVNVEVWGGSSREDHGRFVFRNYVGGLPYIHDPDFVRLFNEAILKHEIDLVFPTHDTVAQYFSERRREWACRIVTAEAETAKICREKRLTYLTFADCSFVPQTFANLAAIKRFPIFLKPNIGEGAKHTRIAYAHSEASSALALGPDLLIVEYLPGEEYTVDCFTDRHGKLRFTGPRVRSRVHGGISVHSKTVKPTQEIQEIAEEINRRLRLRGLWFFQLKKTADGKCKLLEISVRVAGTMCVYRQLGVNLPLLSIYDVLDHEVDILMGAFDVAVDRALTNRFEMGIDYDRIYLDFDDTLICRGEVNPNVLLLLYQAARERKPVHLLTRHAKDIHHTLSEAKIHPALFAEIRTLRWHEEKHNAVDRLGKPIFIDNAFAERKKVQQHLGIPVFDVDAVGCLLDWRT